MAQVPPLSAISAPIEKARKRPGPVKEFFSKLGWYAGCVITLGYAPKYYRKILKWQVYDLSKKNKDRPAYLEDFNSKALGLETSVRAKQQVSLSYLRLSMSIDNVPRCYSANGTDLSCQCVLALAHPFAVSLINPTDLRPSYLS